MQPNEQFESSRSPEIHEQAREIILIFQRAKAAQDGTERARLMQEFYQKLIAIVTPPNEGFFERTDQDLINIVLENTTHNYLSVGGGTSGQRIYFRNTIMIPMDKDAKKYGADLQATEFSGFYELESQDGKPRWMTYHKPEGSNWPHGQRYWEKFIATFGDDIVDLLQKIEQKR